MIDKSIDRDYSAIVDRKSIPGLARLDSELEQHQSFSYLFVIIFVGIAILVIATSMGRMVEQQRTQIGTMNALGLKRHKIMLHYISFSLVVSVVGVVLGLLAGTLWGSRQSLVCLQTGISCRVCIRYSIRCILSLQQASWQYVCLHPI